MTIESQDSPDPSGIVVRNSQIETSGGDIAGRDKIVGDNIFVGPTFFAPPIPQPAKDTPLGSSRPGRLLPYLTDRAEQQRQLAASLQERFDIGSNQAMTFFIIGREDECLDSFVEQIRYVKLPAILQSNNFPTEILYRSLQWVNDESLAEISSQSAEDPLFDVKYQIHDALGLRMTVSSAAIEQKLASFPMSCVFHVGLAVSDWSRAQAALMATFVRWLGTIKLEKARLPIVVLISIVCPSSFLSSIWWRRAAALLRRDIRLLVDSKEHNAAVRALPELHSLRFDDVEIWIRENVENVDREVLRRRVRRHFSNRFGVGQRRLSMYRTAEVVKAALSDPAVQMSKSL